MVRAQFMSHRKRVLLSVGNREDSDQSSRKRGLCDSVYIISRIFELSIHSVNSTGTSQNCIKTIFG